MEGRDFSKAIIIFLLFGLLFTLTANKIPSDLDTDTWWHLKSGEYIFQHRAIPQTDPFSHTVPDHTWIDLHWVFQLMIFIIYSAGGIIGLNLLVILLSGVTIALLMGIAGRGSYSMAGISVFFLTVMVASSRFTARPEIISFLFLALYFAILEQYTRKDTRLLYLLPLLQILWVNCHALFVLGWVITFAYIGSEVIKRIVPLPWVWRGEGPMPAQRFYRLLLVGCLLIGSSFVNPYTYRGVVLPFTLFSEIQTPTVMEYIPPLSKRLISSNWPVLFYYKIFLIISALSFLLNIRHWHLVHLFLYANFLYLSLRAVRNMAPFALLAAPITIRNLQSISLYLAPFWLKFPSKARIISRVAGQTFLVAVLLFYIYDIIADRYYLRIDWTRRFGFGVSEIACPEKAVDFLLKAGLKGNIFNNDAIGGYLIWRLFPQSKVFVDGRMQVYGLAFLQYYNAILGQNWLWDECVKKYKIDYVVLGYAHSLLETEKLIRYLYQHLQWKLVYFDEQVVVFVRDIPQHKELIDKYKIDIQTISRLPSSTDISQEDIGRWTRLRAKASALLQRQRFPFTEYALGYLFAILGRTDLAEVYFQRALTIYPHHPDTRYALGRLYEQKGLTDKAIKEYKGTLELRPDYASVHYSLGLIYENKGLYREAEVEYRAVLEIDYNHTDGRVNLGIVLGKQGLHKQAIKELQEAIKLSPKHINAHLNLAIAYLNNKMLSEGIAELHQVLQLEPKNKMAQDLLKRYGHKREQGHGYGYQGK